MVFYEIKGKITGLVTDAGTKKLVEEMSALGLDTSEQELSGNEFNSMFEGNGYLKTIENKKIAPVIDDFTREAFDDQMRIDVLSIQKDQFRFIATTNFEHLQKFPLEANGNELLKKLGFSGEVTNVSEITHNSYCRSIEKSDRLGFCYDYHQVMQDFKVHGTSREFAFVERIFTPLTDEREKELSKNIEELCVDGLKEEIERIVANPKYGTPVHYIIQMEDILSCKHVYNLLAPVMHKYGRIKRQLINVWGTDYMKRSMFGEAVMPPIDDLQTFYDISECGVAVIRSMFEESIGNYQKGDYEIIKRVTDIIKQNKKNVVTILCVEKKAQAQLKAWKENLEDMTFVEITEKTIFKSDAETYMFALAEKDACAHINGLFEMIEDEKGYTRTDLDKVYATWYAGYQKTELFPEYKDLAAFEKKIDGEVEGIAYSKLENMIGLDKAKKQIQEIINFAKVQKLIKDKGIEQTEVCKHMVFTGNPGTAKTTVARLFAQIMKDNQLLTSGRFVEAGRGDLVGKYVGHTAPLVQSKFKEAKGGVLFIDEAYSLCDGKEGLFGDEAISAIVQEMENRRDDTIVIFAGYKKEMNNFINRNSGLKSRIAHYVDFPDYNEDDLGKILKYMADEQKLVLGGGTEKIAEILQTATKSENFGNGRFARNLLDKARLKHANRVAKLPDPSVEDITTLLAEDFELPEEYAKQRIAIGF